jgi:hypothetical protein
MPLPNHYRSPWFQKLFDLGHLPIFAMVTICAWRIVGRIWLASSIATAVAVAAEIGQGLAGRSPDFLDVVRSMLGVAIGAVALFAFRRPLHRRAIAIGLATILILTAWPIWDSSPVLVDAIWARRSFPVLSDFASPWEARRWSTQGAILERQMTDRGNSAVGLLQVPAGGGGAILFPIVRDWRGYKRLSWTFSFDGDPLDILFSVRDGRRVEPPQRRFDLMARYAAGQHSVVIDLVDLAAGTQFAPLDLSRIQSLHIVVMPSTEPRTLILRTLVLD